MIPAHQCFPKDWIGETPKKINDYSCQIGNASTRQVMMPSGYGKLTHAYWIPDGVLVLCSDTNGIKFFFVGYQQSFIAYNNESEPHDIKAYREAVEKCKRMRAGVAPNSISQNENKSCAKTDSQDKKGNNKSKVKIGDTLRRAKTSVKNFRSISDSSKFEADANEIVNDYISDQINWFADSQKRIDDELRNSRSLEERRDQEIDILRKAVTKYDAKELKKRIFANLNAIFKEDYGINFIEADDLAKFIGVRTPDLKNIVSLALEACRESYRELGSSEKFIIYWSEIFYLIEEGLLFTSHTIEFITKIISKECGGSNTTGLEEGDNIDGFIEMCYSKFSHYVYRGQNFEKDPLEDKVRERLDYLEQHFFFYDEEYVEASFDLNDLLDDSEDNYCDDNDTGSVGDDEDEAEDWDDENDDDDDDDDEDEDEAEDWDDADDEDDDDDEDVEYQVLLGEETIQAVNIFPELLEKFTKEEDIDESLPTKGLFDFSTRKRNFKVSNLKDKRLNLQDDIDYGKKVIRREIISILKLRDQIVPKEKIFEELAAQKPRSEREQEKLENKMEKVEDAIQSIKDDIICCNTEIKNTLKSLISDIRSYNEICSKLFDLTSSPRYNTEFSINNKVIGLATEISKDVDLTDSKKIETLFKKYLL